MICYREEFLKLTFQSEALTVIEFYPHRGSVTVSLETHPLILKPDPI